MHSIFHKTLGLWLALFIVGCSGSSEQSHIKIRVSTQSLSTQDIARVVLTISGPSISPNIEQELLEDGQWVDFIGQIPAGSNRTFTARAFNSQNAVIYEGQVDNVTVTENEQTVMILLQQKTAPAPFTNAVPEVTGVLLTTSTPQTNQQVSLQAMAQDADLSDTITYSWSATGGTFGNPNSNNTHWTAPATSGTHTLALTVSDNRGGQVTANFEVQVQ